MQWQVDPRDEALAQNYRVDWQGGRPAAPSERLGFLPVDPVLPQTEPISKPANEPAGGKKKSMLRVGKRLERQGLGQVTGELQTSLLSKVYALLAFSLAFTFAGLVAGYQLDPGWILPIFVVQIGLIVALNSWREEAGLNLVLLYAFCAFTGMTLGPLIAELADAGMMNVVFQAGLATVVITGCMFVIGRSIERDLYAWGPFLFATLLAFIVLQLTNQLLFNAPLGQVLLSFGGVVLFSLYLVFDINRIRHLPDTMGNAVLICLDIYLDIINIFVNLLQILFEMASEGD